VIPVPNLPDYYGVASAELFQEIDKALFRQPRYASEETAPMLRGRPNEEITVHKAEHVGEYTIRPIEVSGSGAGDTLNRWLLDEGFQAIDEANLQYYTSNEFVFLAIRVDTDRMKGSMRPLRISFQSDQIFYPLKFSSHQGVFHCGIYLLTHTRLEEAKLRKIIKWGFKYRPNLLDPLYRHRTTPFSKQISWKQNIPKIAKELHAGSPLAATKVPPPSETVWATYIGGIINQKSFPLEKAQSDFFIDGN